VVSLKSVVSSYCLLRDLKPKSQEQVHRIVGVYLSWAHREDLPATEFTADAISRFLLDKQTAGRSSHYRRSLRNTLRALYRFANNGHSEPIRPVRLDSLEPDSWTPEEVDRLIQACDEIRLTMYERWRWRTLIGTAYTTGLNACDLHRIERRHITASGVIPFVRAKTGKRVCVCLPMGLLEEICQRAPQDGPIWPRYRSEEAERVQFSHIVKAAKLTGTFKKLRKTCGTQVELLYPGRGPEQLGNEREIFDKHYADRKILAPAPVMPPALRSFG
jgi:integrase